MGLLAVKAASRKIFLRCKHTLDDGLTYTYTPSVAIPT